MTEISCACANQQALWIAGDNPVDEPVSKSTYAMSLTLNKTLTSDIQQAMLDALDLLNARVDALTADISTILGILDSPLTATESIERLRAVREGLL